MNYFFDSDLQEQRDQHHRSIDGVDPSIERQINRRQLHFNLVSLYFVYFNLVYDYFVGRGDVPRDCPRDLRPRRAASRPAGVARTRVRRRAPPPFPSLPPRSRGLVRRDVLHGGSAALSAEATFLAAVHAASSAARGPASLPLPLNPPWRPRPRASRGPAKNTATATTKAADTSRKMPRRPYLGRQATRGREPPPRIYRCCCVGVGWNVHRRGVSKVE